MSSSTKKKSDPRSKEVIKLLHNLNADSKRKKTITTKNSTKEKMYLVYNYLHEHANSFNHLKSCIANSKRDKLIAIYEQNLKLKQTSIFDFFESTLPVIEKEMEIVYYVEFIIEKGLTIFLL